MAVLDHLTFLAILFGIICGLLIKPKRRAFALAIGVPILATLFILLYSEYFVPYSGGGASMWPIGLIFVSTPAAICGGLACALANLLVKWIGD